MPLSQPWTFPQPYTEADADKFAGFVYLITNTETGRAYVGKKFFFAKVNKKPARSNWRSYYGSSKPLKADIDKLGKDKFKREILSLHATRQEVNYAEVMEQFKRDVLNMRMLKPDGSSERAYYNLNIASKWFYSSPASALKAVKTRSTLSDGQVRTIRASTDTLQVLSLRFGVCRSTISNIKSGKSYSWVTAE